MPGDADDHTLLLPRRECRIDGCLRRASEAARPVSALQPGIHRFDDLAPLLRRHAARELRRKWLAGCCEVSALDRQAGARRRRAVLLGAAISH